MVMPLYDGVTLKDKLRSMNGPPDEAWLMSLLAPLTEALAILHAENCFHRDIAPDNVILLSGSERPVLLDFGAARRVIGDMTQVLTVILKPGYAPVEQYAEAPNMKQGPWTDVYALAATVYWAVTGKTPPAAVGRIVSDEYQPLARAAAGRYSARFLEAVDRALIVRPEGRTQTIAAFRRDLGIDSSDHAATLPLTSPPGDDATVILPAGGRSTVPPMPTVAPPPPTTAARQPEGVAKAPRESDRPARSPIGIGLGIGGVAVAIAAGAAWWALRPTTPAVTPGAVPASAASPAVPIAAPAPAPAPSAPTLENIVPPPSVPIEAAAAPSPAPAPAPKRERPAPTPAPARGDTTPTEPKTEARAESKSDAARECAQIFQRLSLGEDRPDLIERAKTLKCR